MNTTELHGVVIAPITPMNGDLSIDHAALAELIERQIDDGATGFTPCAMTGEAETLDLDEQRAVIETVVAAAAGRVPVIAGVGRPSLIETRRLIHDVAAIGADGLFLISPYASPMTAADTMEYITVLVAEAAVPTMIYNAVGYSSAALTAGEIAELSRRDHVVWIKEGDQAQLHDTCRLAAEGFGVFTARDSYLLPSMVVGARGVVSFVANCAPAAVVELYRASAAGLVDEARALTGVVSELVAAITARSYPVLVKAATGLAGYPSGPCRRVGGGASDAELRRIAAALQVAEECMDSRMQVRIQS